MQKDCGGNCVDGLQYVQEYLRLPEVIRAVGSDVDDFEMCSQAVAKDFLQWSDDYSKSGMHDLADMLNAGIDVLLYDGEYDWVASWPGVYRVAERLRHDAHSEFNAKPVNVWYVDGEPAAETKKAGHLAWMKVYNSGHLVPHDQGKHALALAQQWLHSRAFVDVW